MATKLAGMKASKDPGIRSPIGHLAYGCASRTIGRSPGSAPVRGPPSAVPRPAPTRAAATPQPEEAQA
ncbi:hypothetical protein PGT21_001802 [Puccinia graminis f. sp. tritici]|uniref:Uncharacterized protein n=1 Tax=Puccinia graminis f. sp. tritici TaxID=56615 RepID=A0A5B0MMQ5_PUCGR|nr:hypothetical protein PGT21_001802 [Puccinia graminis f. sp. tritici]